MPSTISFSQGDVVLVPFPFTDLSATKQPPALVLSPDRSNRVRPDLVVAAITSQIPAPPGDDEMLLSGNELKETGLPKPSIIKLSKIFTIHQGLIRKKIGQISDSTRAEILEKLMQSLR
jgi:mRNA-degrading endonuclease toxin of MazEF toxin-antitoxin module